MRNFRFPQPQKIIEVEEYNQKTEWVATSWRPDPITLEANAVFIGRGHSNRKDTINVLLETLPIADQDNFCRITISTVDGEDLEKEWPKVWTVLSYKTDRMGHTKKNVIGSAWTEENEILIYLDSLPTPNQNVECWIALKPKLEKKNEKQQANI